MILRLAILLSATLVLLLAPLSALAKGPFDGSKPLLCTGRAL